VPPTGNITGKFRESLVEYDIASGEEIFISYSQGREFGPGIERTGKGPPVMEDLSRDAIPGSTTTNPLGQRLRSWLILDALRADDLDEFYTAIRRPWYDLELWRKSSEEIKIDEKAKDKPLIVVFKSDSDGAAALHFRHRDANGNVEGDDAIERRKTSSKDGQNAVEKAMKDLGPLFEVMISERSMLTSEKDHFLRILQSAGAFNFKDPAKAESDEKLDPGPP